MPRKILRRLLPTQGHLRERHGLRRLFGQLLHDPNLWHLNRYSVAGGVSVGLFVAFVPVPFQMLLAAALAIVAGCNLPVAVVFVWLSNPLTIPPLFFAAYELGAWILDVTPRAVRFELSVSWLLTELGEIWRPFLLGCFLLGAGTAAIGHVTVRVIWRIHVVASWRERARRRRAPGESPDGSRGTE